MIAPPDQVHREFLSWLCPPGAAKSLSNTSKEVCLGTGQWLLAREEYLEWRDGSTALLWAYGDRMSYKTSLLALLIDPSWCWEDLPRVSLHFLHSWALLI